MNVDYDKDKFYQDEYGNLYPKTDDIGDYEIDKELGENAPDKDNN